MEVPICIEGVGDWRAMDGFNAAESPEGISVAMVVC